MKRAVKVAVGLALVAILAVLFVRSARQSRSEPYTIPGEQLRTWSVVLDPAATPGSPVMVLKPATDPAPDLFRQLFARVMESMSVPTVSGMPLVMKDEFDRSFAGQVTPDDLALAARDAGLESSALEPECLGYRRLSEPGMTRQLYFLLFNAPAFRQFRQAIAARASGDVPFDADALSAVLLVAQSGPGGGWLPLRADAGADCVAPIDVE